MGAIWTFISSLFPNYIAAFLPSGDKLAVFITLWVFLAIFLGRWCWQKVMLARSNKNPFKVIFPIALIALSLVGLLGGGIMLARIREATASQHATYALAPHIYSEAHSIKAKNGRETKLYENTFYLVVGNSSDDGATLKRVQAEIQGYETPVLAPIKDSALSEIDLKHGQWAFFAVGRIVSTANIGLFKGSVTIDDDQLKFFEHNVPLGGLKFDVWSFDNKRHYGLGGPSYPSDGWKMTMLISSQDKKSKQIALNIDPQNQKTPVTYDSSERSVRELR